MTGRQQSTLLGLALAGAMFLAIPSYAQVPPTILRVDGDSGLTVQEGADGLDWPTAFEFLQDALAEAAEDASEFNPYEIWVAATDPANPYLPSGLGFQMNNFVGIYGGFLGTDNPQGPETDRDQRNFLANVTVLSGDLDGDDDDIGGSNANNSTHVVFTSFNLDQTAILNGFTVTAGNADGDADNRSGGGIFSKGAQMIVN